MRQRQPSKTPLSFPVPRSPHFCPTPWRQRSNTASHRTSPGLPCLRMRQLRDFTQLLFVLRQRAVKPFAAIAQRCRDRYRDHAQTQARCGERGPTHGNAECREAEAGSARNNSDCGRMQTGVAPITRLVRSEPFAFYQRVLVRADLLDSLTGENFRKTDQAFDIVILV